MSDNQALHNHPDAGLLAAFAERALSAPERAELAAHLAGCARCRDIVFLAQQAQPEQLNQVSLASPRPRIRLWLTLASAACAAVLLAVVSHAWLQHLARPVGNTELSLAQHPSAPAPAIPVVAAPAAKSVPAPAPGQPAHRAAPEPAPSAAPSSTGIVSATYSSPVSAQFTAESAPPASLAAPPPPEPVHPMPQARMAMQKEKAAQQQVEAGRLMPSAAEADTASAEPGQAPVHGAAPPPSAETRSAAAFLTAPAPRAPANFVPASRVQIQNRILALDAAGALFASDDAGRHWRSLPSPCAGPATAITALPQTANQSAATSAPSAVRLVCSSGGSWTSVDRGNTWQPEAAAKP